MVETTGFTLGLRIISGSFWKRPASGLNSGVSINWRKRLASRVRNPWRDSSDRPRFNMSACTITQASAHLAARGSEESRQGSYLAIDELDNVPREIAVKLLDRPLDVQQHVEPLVNAEEGQPQPVVQLHQLFRPSRERRVHLYVTAARQPIHYDCLSSFNILTSQFDKSKGVELPSVPYGPSR